MKKSENTHKEKHSELFGNGGKKSALGKQEDILDTIFKDITKVEPKVFIEFRHQHDFQNQNLQQKSLSHTDNKVSCSFTATNVSVHTSNEVKKLTDDEIRMEY
jgi:hypothetical protein